MDDFLRRLLQVADVLDWDRAAALWAEYRDGGPGAADAYAVLLAWFGRDVYRRVWVAVGPRDAEDVFQNVLKKWHARRKRFSTVEHAVNSLYAVARTECADARRRAARNRRDAVPRPVLDPGPSDEDREALAVALARLSKKHRDVVEQVFLSGMDIRDAARLLGIDRGTASKRLNEALDQLRKLLPVTAVAGGVVGVPAALTARALPLPAARLAEIAGAAWEATTPARTAWTKPALAAAAVVLAGGLAVGGWSATDDQQGKSSPAAHTRERSAGRETLQDRNRRLFEAEVQEELIALLSRLAMGGGGRATVEEVRCFDTRVVCRATVHHDRPAGVQSKWDIVYDTGNGALRYRVDYLGNGNWRDLDTGQPMYWDPPWGGKRIVVRFAELDRITAAFAAAYPPDPRAQAESDSRTEAFRRAAWSYEGVWFERGDAAKPIRVRVTPANPMPVEITFFDGHRGGVLQIELRVGADGLLRGLGFHHVEAVPTPDGARLDFPGTGFWWTREPTKAWQ